MSAGTIALTNNSATVTGTGTAFTTDLKANDFIVVIVGGVTYTLGVKATTTATALTLITPYGGPTATGNAWTAVPNAALVGITAQVAADVAKAIRGLNLDKANWQQVFSGKGTITVTLPDGSTYSGPSWKYLSDNMATKVSGAVPVNQGGTGATTASQAVANLGGFGSGAGNFAQGNDSRLGTIDGKSGGIITNGLYINGSNSVSGTQGYIGFRNAAGTEYSAVYSENAGNFTIATNRAGTNSYFQHLQNGNMIIGGVLTCTSVTQTSDATKKKQVEPIDDALSKINKLDGVTFLWKESGMPSAGIIAQQLMEVLPESVSSVFDDNDEYGDVEVEETDPETGEMKRVKVRELIRERDDSLRSYSVEYSGVVALAVEAIKELSAKVSQLEAFIGSEKLASPSEDESAS